MNDLSPEARRTLAQAKIGQPRASHALRARVKENVLRAVAEASPPEAAHGGATASAKSASAKLPAWAVPTLGAIVVIGGIATFALQQRSDDRSRPVPSTLDDVSPVPLVAKDEASATSAHGIVGGREDAQFAGDAQDSTAVEEQASESRDAQPPRRTKTRNGDSANAPARARDAGLRAELQLLARAEAALRAGEMQSTLSILEVHALQFSSGQLQGERDGLRLIAQCALGRDPQSALARYLREHRDGVLQGRIRASCARFLP